MSSSFAARRKARIIAQDDGEEHEPGQAQSHVTDHTSRPSTGADTQSLSRSSSKTKKKKPSRISFGPGGTSMTEDDDAAAPTPIFTPKKSNLSRQAISNNSLRKSLASNSTPLRQSLDDRPSYSAEHLNELKSSTPSTPKILDTVATDEESSALDLAAKFGSDLSVYASRSAIPTDAEIKEKKARRARLAKEEEYINLHGGGSDESDDDDDQNEITLRSQKDYPETRLVREDEDMAEGFEDYVDDGRIALGRRAEQEQRRKQKSEMETLINEAEGGGGAGSSSNETDESEVERLQAFEGTQTRAGMDGLQKLHEDADQPHRPRTPPTITPLPTLNRCLEKLRASLAKMQYEKIQRMRQLEEVRKEKLEMAAREVEIQRLLREVGEGYEKLRGGIGAELAAATNGHMMLENGGVTAGQGLESI
ncbi:MAG: hypothetical protein Q9207_003858 [Kuettlingeria erythrocarpa]